MWHTQKNLIKERTNEQGEQYTHVQEQTVKYLGPPPGGPPALMGTGKKIPFEILGNI